MEHEVPNRSDDISDYEDSELPDLPTFSATNEFASVCEQVKENIDVNTARELEEVQAEDEEMDEDYDIDHSNTEEALQLSPAKNPFLVFMELDYQSCFFLYTILSSISNELIQVDAHGVVLGLYLATGKHFKSELIGYHADDDDGLEL
ncbi:hypothetical protein Tco_0398481 [Tanacetum coccineum]